MTTKALTSAPKPLTRADILGKGTPELERREVYIPEWDGTVWVRAFSARDTDAISRLQDQQERRAPNGRPQKPVSIRAHLVIRGTCDERGEPIFAMADADWLAAQPVTVLNRILAVLTELNGGEDLEGELEKNSESDPSDASPSS